MTNFSRRSVMAGAGAVAALAPLRFARAASKPAVVAFHLDALMLDPSGRARPYRAAPARAVSLPDGAYAWRPFL
jgi:hypothetical protein